MKFIGLRVCVKATNLALWPRIMKNPGKIQTESNTQ
jgi:hypothetical protein